MFCFSPEAIDITAALARCAMSRTELPGDFAAGFVSAGAAGVLSATCGEPAACFVFGASASFGATMAFDASASFGAATGFGASASLGASASGGAAATRDGSLCGAEAANLSLNIIEAGSLSGFDSAARRRQRGEHLVERRRRRACRDNAVVCLDDGRIERRAAHRRIDAGAENIGVDGPGAAQHKPCDRSACEEMLREDFPGRLLAGGAARPNAPVLVLIRLASRTVPLTSS